MAQNNKFRMPQVAEQSDRQYASPPPVVEEAPFLREIANPDVIHAYTKEMAKRGDLVEPYWPEVEAKAKTKRRRVQTSADKEPAVAPVAPPVVPLPPSIPVPPPAPPAPPTEK